MDTRGQVYQTYALRDLTAVGNLDLLGGLARLGAEALNLLDDIHAGGDRAEDDVLPVEPPGLNRAEEELETRKN